MKVKMWKVKEGRKKTVIPLSKLRIKLKGVHSIEFVIQYSQFSFNIKLCCTCIYCEAPF